METTHEIRPVKKDKESELFDIPGVTGVDIGNKYVGGEKTDELAIRVYVEEKKDVEDIPKDELIPDTIEGVKTDVRQREFVLHPLRVRLADLKIMADTVMYDPLQGGISIGPCRVINGYIYVGTLGAIAKDRNTRNPMLLSNFHVMCVDDHWSIGDDVTQPSRVDGGICPRDVAGSLQRAVLSGTTVGGGPGVDCAVSSCDRRYSCRVADISEIRGTLAANVDMAVRKRGRTTGLTYGTVDTVDLTVNIDYGNGLGKVRLEDQIGIEVDLTQSAAFGLGGDSGSVVVSRANYVVGLYFAGSEEVVDNLGNVIEPAGVYGVANPIQAVEDALDVKICTPCVFRTIRYGVRG